MTDLELYQQAKEAYYNGTPIMEDIEFDELEKRLGLENKSYVGTKHNPAYTEKHPFIMGSLSKVQIKESVLGDPSSVEWDKFFGEASKYLTHNMPNMPKVIVTPKYDGCSFEVYVKDCKVVSVSTRGDGEYGKDIKPHIIKKVMSNVEAMNKIESEYVLRGEGLVDKSVFVEKYSEFVNPRSFVAGLLNRDYTEEIEPMLDDLSIVVYDLRIKENGSWEDCDWTRYDKYIPSRPEFYKEITGLDINSFKEVYDTFAEYRRNCNFALDGFVIKPTDEYRVTIFEDARPKDCIAIKFIPMLEETVVEEIMWSTRKTNELIPVIRVKAVEMDGKEVTKASAHNYGFVLDKKISVGTRVILSLAGDIIPFIYKITNTDEFAESKMCIPNDIETYIDGCHLYKKMTADEIHEKNFVQSAAALAIPTIGPAAAQTIYDYMKNECRGDEFFGIEAKETPDNILMVLPADIDRALGGKLGSNAAKAMTTYLKGITLTDIIVSCTFDSCGRKIAEQIANYMMGVDYDFSHLASKAYEWCYNEQSEEMQKINKILAVLGMSANDFKEVATVKATVNSDQIPVILTGEPNDYTTKADFLRQHPEYRMTTKWTEVKIVFTNSLESTTGKMKKAMEKGIEIRLY